MKLSESIMAMAAIDAEHYDRNEKWAAKGNGSAAERYTLQTPVRLSVNIDNIGYAITTQADLDLSASATWDQVVTDYRVAATRAGKDFYVYACQQVSDNPKFLISASSTFPAGYSAANSRKVSGFHCLCVAVGTIAGHTLTDYAQGDILPASVWDILHRPVSEPEGMVYSEELHKWIDIYLASGTGASIVSVNGGTISKTRNWMDFVDDFSAVKKRLLTNPEFQSIAAGSNEETSISGSADPVTTGGHSDTVGRRMVSNIGCEDCCGALNQWLSDQSWRADALPDTGDPTWGWYDLPGAKGSLYRQGTYGDVKFAAGGHWAAGMDCGSRCRRASDYRWITYSFLSARALAEQK